MAIGSTPTRKRAPLYEEVAEQVRELIYDYQLPPGEWIDEPDLCERLGISRTPLREALKLLAAEGLVQIDAGRGSRVTRLTLEDLNQLFPVMAMLEGRCAHEAVRHIDDAGLALLESLHAAMESAVETGNIAEYYRNNYVIHETVQRYAGNPWLIRITHDQKMRFLRQGRQKLRHQWCIHHRGFINDKEVAFQRLLGVASPLATALKFQEPMHGLRLQARAFI